MKANVCAIFLLAIAFLLVACGGAVETEETEVLPEAYSPVVTVTNPYDLPTLHITSSYHPFEVERNFWHSGTMALTNHEAAFHPVDIRIRGRGNSTWIFGEEKRPLRIRFEEPQSMFGSDYTARDWVMIANLFDLTLMRTYLAFYLADNLGTFDFNPMTQLAHVYINGEYMGIYQFTDERDIQPGRMELYFNQNPALSEYLFEMDASALRTGNLDIDFFIAEGRPYDIRFPRNNALSPDHVAYVRDYVYGITEIIRSGDFNAISQAIDLESFIDFYLVQELFKNIDIGMNSVFMQIRGADRRLYFGPVWDFDRSAGNMYYWYTYQHLHAGYRNHFFAYLITVPEVFEMIATRWEAIRDNEVYAMLVQAQYYLDHHQDDFDRNFHRFNVWETSPDWMHSLLPPHLHEITTWAGQMEHMLYWFDGRIWWLNQFFLEDEDLRQLWLDTVVASVQGN